MRLCKAIYLDIDTDFMILELSLTQRIEQKIGTEVVMIRVMIRMMIRMMIRVMIRRMVRIVFLRGHLVTYISSS